MPVLESDAICQELIEDWSGTVAEVRATVDGEVPEEAVVLVVQSRRRIGWPRFRPPDNMRIPGGR
ncbi:hypothetical protein [Kitasatospora sp. NPDC087271]|uniref:hypothetical protein n=1 Tax=Kitasatospora sp. NPDC087271 TaxID=3364067 RepID=UPI003828D0F0